MRCIHILEFLKFPHPPLTNLKLVNIRGCNGAGKSTIPKQMLYTDPTSFEIYINTFSGHKKFIATVFPKYNFIALGHYHSNTGGMDTLSDTQQIKDLTSMFWECNFNLLLEGIMASTVRQTYIDLFQEMNQIQKTKREVIIYNLVPPLDLCLQRIQERNGGKQIKEDSVESKWKTIQRNIPYFKEAGFNTITVDNSTISMEKILPQFFNHIFPVSTQTSVADSPQLEIVPQSVAEPKEYEWSSKYKEPNCNLQLDTKFFDIYWYFIAERMNIWYKRVILKQPEPWTDDPILQQYKFTNVIRDLDKLSIYERKHILNKIDEIQDNWCENKILKWKQSILLNIMIFRLWVKIDTYEVHGFIDLSNPFWKDNWNTAKQQLLERREKGISNFTAAYYVNDLHIANPDRSTRNNKTQNAICLVEYWMNHIDEIYDWGIVQSRNMREQLDYFQTLRCVGAFTAYEWCCSIAEITRYCKNHLVNWTQDNDTNVGPGAQRGINWIFKNTGGLTDYQCILWLRSIWKQELQKRGTYDRFVSQLPKEMNGDIDLRVIEHCLCETQKYNKALTETGRPKETFKPRTENVEELRA